MTEKAIILEFAVQGSAAEPYKVRFFKGASHISFSCNCQAGSNGSHCKHRLALMDGNKKSLVSGNDADVTLLRRMLEGTDLKAALDEYLKAEADCERAKSRLSEAKKNLARALN